MPFSSTKSCTSEEWTEIFKDVHSLAITESKLGYECQRSNIRPGAFIKDILTMINQADVVLADLTDMIPNVLYELGVRHTLKNRTILVSQSSDKIPSDIKQYGVIEYKREAVGEYKQKIKRILKNIRDDPERSDNPVSDYLHLKSVVRDPFEAKSIEKKLWALLSECEYNLKVIDDALEATKSFYEESINADPLEVAKSFYEESINARFHSGALEILISTYYIYPNKNYIGLAHDLFDNITALNTKLELMIEKNFRSAAKKELLKRFPYHKENIKTFMKETKKLLNDFRNQNFIETDELAIYVTKEEHNIY